MNLQANEALRSKMLFVGIPEVGSRYSIEPGLDVIATALDDDGVPVIPFETLLPAGGEFLPGLLSPLQGKLSGEEPAAPGLIVNARGIGAVPVVVMFALVAEDPALAIALLGTELAPGIAGGISELELEDEDEVPVVLFGAQEGIAANVPAVAHDGSVFHLVFSGSTSLAPTVEAPAIEEWRETCFKQDVGICRGWHIGACVSFGPCSEKGSQEEQDGKDRKELHSADDWG